MKYDPIWLQEEANRLGSWNKVCSAHNISPRTIDKYKKNNLISNVDNKAKVDLKLIQSMYDNGMSIRKISEELNIPHSLFSREIKTRTNKEARKIADHKISNKGLEKLSKLAKERSLGGYRPHPNKGQYYKDVWFDSMWEVKVAKSLDENSILWSRPSKGFIWNKEGNKYYPDFYIEEFDVYLDPKNDYLIKKDEEKISNAKVLNNIKVIVLNGNELDWTVIKNKIESYNSSVVE